MPKLPSFDKLDPWIARLSLVLGIFSTFLSIVGSVYIPHDLFTRTQIIGSLTTISFIIIIIYIFYLFARSAVFRKRYLKSALVIAIVLLICVGLVWYYNQANIRIVQPQEGDILPSTIDVRGLAKNVPMDETIWLMVVSPMGRFYPHSPEIMPNIQTGEWMLNGVTIGTQADEGKRFYLLTTTVDANTKSYLDDYFEKAARTGSWEGLERLPPGIKVQDRVTIVRSK